MQAKVVILLIHVFYCILSLIWAVNHVSTAILYLVWFVRFYSHEIHSIHIDYYLLESGLSICYFRHKLLGATFCEMTRLPP